MGSDSWADRLNTIKDKIARAASACGRDAQSVTLVAVSKTHPIEDIQALYDLGVRDFGESYVQEWQDKAAALPADIRWHLIGHLQTNKVKYLEDRLWLLHSVDRASLIKELAKRAQAPVQVLLQVNVAGEDSKFGCTPEALPALLEQALDAEHIIVRGLMTVPPYVDVAAENAPNFAALAKLLKQLRQRVAQAQPDHAFDLLSMGMTVDFEEAIVHGSTHVRVGTALFGERDYGARS